MTKTSNPTNVVIIDRIVSVIFVLGGLAFLRWDTTVSTSYIGFLVVVAGIVNTLSNQLVASLLSVTEKNFLGSVGSGAQGANTGVSPRSLHN